MVSGFHVTGVTPRWVATVLQAGIKQRATSEVPTLKSGPNKALRLSAVGYWAHSLEWDFLIRMLLILFLDVLDRGLEKSRTHCRD